MSEGRLMSVKNPLLASIDQQAVLIASERKSVFESCLEQVALEIPDLRTKAEQSELADSFWYEEGSYMERYRPYEVKDGVLHLPVRGALLKDFGYTTRFATGYDYIWEAFKRGIGDSEVRAIALVVDSPGGMASGCFDLVDKMYEVRDAKPVRAFASDHAYSAAYAIASVAQNGITVSRTGGVGSVGVVQMHVNWAAYNDKVGIEITYIFAGEHKVDGNPDEPLSDAVKARMQARIDALYDEFVSTVARNRAMDEQVVRDTEALTFTAKEALSNGMADSIGSFDDAVADFAAETSQKNGDPEMSTKPDDTAAAQQAAVENARAEGVTAGMTQGATAERQRINAILACDEAKARPKAALSAALKSDMSAETVAAFLADLPEEASATPEPKGENVVDPSAGAPKGMFTQAMDGTPNPGIDAGNNSGEAKTDDDIVDTIMRDAGRGARKVA
jgi:signal peptide peptidase SppA